MLNLCKLIITTNRFEVVALCDLVDLKFQS